ncbi:hypothetical protein [Ottowia sp.]|uniref:hypothetical protein n=1 Tax=Ottowia sp. TaxID=1898956 RepID=UPI0025E1FAEE|nr:hypothetical protein [Ottowia sp.]
MRNNNTDTSITCTIGAGADSCTAAGSVSFVAGDKINVSVSYGGSGGGGGTSRTFSWTGYYGNVPALPTIIN